MEEADTPTAAVLTATATRWKRRPPLPPHVLAAAATPPKSREESMLFMAVVRGDARPRVLGSEYGDAEAATPLPVTQPGAKRVAPPPGKAFLHRATPARLPGRGGAAPGQTEARDTTHLARQAAQQDAAAAEMVANMPPKKSARDARLIAACIDGTAPDGKLHPKRGSELQAAEDAHRAAELAAGEPDPDLLARALRVRSDADALQVVPDDEGLDEEARAAVARHAYIEKQRAAAHARAVAAAQGKWHADATAALALHRRAAGRQVVDNGDTAAAADADEWQAPLYGAQDAADTEEVDEEEAALMQRRRHRSHAWHDAQQAVALATTAAVGASAIDTVPRYRKGTAASAADAVRGLTAAVQQPPESDAATLLRLAGAEHVETYDTRRTLQALVAATPGYTEQRKPIHTRDGMEGMWVPGYLALDGRQGIEAAAAARAAGRRVAREAKQPRTKAAAASLCVHDDDKAADDEGRGKYDTVDDENDEDYDEQDDSARARALEGLRLPRAVPTTATARQQAYLARRANQESATVTRALGERQRAAAVQSLLQVAGDADASEGEEEALPEASRLAPSQWHAMVRAQRSDLEIAALPRRGADAAVHAAEGQEEEQEEEEEEEEYEVVTRPTRLERPSLEALQYVAQRAVGRHAAPQPKQDAEEHTEEGDDEVEQVWDPRVASRDTATTQQRVLAQAWEARTAAYNRRGVAAAAAPSRHATRSKPASFVAHVSSVVASHTATPAAPRDLATARLQVDDDDEDEEAADDEPVVHVPRKRVGSHASAAPPASAMQDISSWAGPLWFGKAAPMRVPTVLTADEEEEEGKDALDDVVQRRAAQAVQPASAKHAGNTRRPGPATAGPATQGGMASMVLVRGSGRRRADVSAGKRDVDDDNDEQNEDADDHIAATHPAATATTNERYARGAAVARWVGTVPRWQ